MRCEITLGNGRVLKDLALSGDTFISSEKLTSKDFAGGLEGVKIECRDIEDGARDLSGTYERMKLAAVFPVGVKTGIVLQEVGKPDELSVEALRAEVDYLKMLAGEE